MLRGAIAAALTPLAAGGDRKSTRLNSSHLVISYAVFCLKKKNHVDADDDLRSPCEPEVHVTRRHGFQALSQPGLFLRCRTGYGRHHAHAVSARSTHLEQR